MTPEKAEDEKAQGQFLGTTIFKVEQNESWRKPKRNIKTRMKLGGGARL